MRLTIAILAAAIAVQAEAAETLKPWQQEALKAVKAEEKVLDARWRTAATNVLYVSMKSNGSRRDGFAQYLCMTLNSLGPAGELKTVWIYAPADYDEGVATEMGLAACR